MMSVDFNSENERFASQFDAGGFSNPRQPAPLPDIDAPPPDDAGERADEVPDFEGDDFLSPQDFADLSPAAQRAYKLRQRKAEKLAKRLEKAEQRAEELQSKVIDALSRGTRNGEEKPKEGWAAYSDAQLSQYLNDADQIQRAYLEDPQNEELRAEARKVNGAHTRAVHEELMRRKLETSVDGRFKKLENERAETRRAAELAQLAESTIRREFGPDVLLRTNDPLLERAREIYAENAEQFGLGDDPGAAAALSVMAMRQANLEINGRGGERRRVDPNVLRHLDVEGRSRRESAAASERSAAARRGDWDTALQHDINDMLRGMGLA